MSRHGSDIRALAAEFKRVSLVSVDTLDDGAASLVQLSESLGRHEALVSLTRACRPADAEKPRSHDGFLVATNQRLIFISPDRGGELIAMPLAQIEMVSLRAYGQALHLRVSSRELVFTDLREGQVFLDRLQKAMGEARAPAPPAAAPDGDDDLVSQLERLVALRQKGVITDAEFQALKARLLAP